MTSRIVILQPFSTKPESFLTKTLNKPTYLLLTFSHFVLKEWISRLLEFTAKNWHYKLSKQNNILFNVDLTRFLIVSVFVD